MQTLHNRRQRFRNSRPLPVALVAIALLLAQFQEGSAAVFAVGDVSPQQTFTGVDIGGQSVDITAPDLPSGGGLLEADDENGESMGTDLIVGGTGLFSGNITLGIGTTTGEVTINNPTGTLPLIAANITIGYMANGKGRINLNDFGTTLIALDELKIGEEGEGELKLTNGAVVGVGVYDPDPALLSYQNGTTIIGELIDTQGNDQYLSEGLMTIDGFGSQFESDDLIVANEGLGTIEVSGKGKMKTLRTTIGEEATATGRVLLTGQGTRWTNLEELIIGNNGTGLLEINDFAVVVADEITIGDTSIVDLTGGTIISNGAALLNRGVIRGNGRGRIESDLVITPAGELRNFGDVGVYHPDETLIVTGTVANGGTIESFGGEMEFESAVTNTFEIIARDTVMRFPAGLTSSGSLTLGGDTTLHGDIDITGGSITVLSDSESALVGDLTFTASAVLSLTVGDAAGTLDVTGSADLTNAILALDYSAGVASQVGDSYQIFQAGGGIAGAFPTSATADGRVWDIDLVGTALIATATGAVSPANGPDFNGDGIVDALDLAIWEANFGLTGPAGSLDMLGDADMDGDVDGRDYFEIVINLGGPPPLGAVVAAVPEPSTLALALLTLACCPRRRAGVGRAA